MSEIAVLDKTTIDKIAAGEVVERPASVVKELVENALDAGADAITIEIKDGGLRFIRVTDNGCGIKKEQIAHAFLRHATSKIRRVEDLSTIDSLGFRGEALSSIAAVGQVELITKTKEQLIGVRYVIEGAEEKDLEEVGAPTGTTFIIRNLFFNTPVRRKFLKSAMTEGNYVTELVECMALSHPATSFKYVWNNQVKLQTSGNGNLKEVIYHIYGRQTAEALLEVETKEGAYTLKGYLGLPVICRGNRSYEHYFINGRYFKSSLIARSLEEGYKSFLIQHKYPFAILHMTMDGEQLDVNVHPTKMEVRFSEPEKVSQFITKTVLDKLTHRELIPQIVLTEEKKTALPPASAPEPFEIQRRAKKETAETPKPPVVAEKVYDKEEEILPFVMETAIYGVTSPRAKEPVSNIIKAAEQVIIEKPSQLTLFEEGFLSKEARQSHRFIGQLFMTYWLVEMEQNLYIIDQHAAHEKVLFERLKEQLEQGSVVSQYISPPIVVTLNAREEQKLMEYKKEFTKSGFVIEHFGGNEFTLHAVPGELYGMHGREFFLELLDNLSVDNSFKEAETAYDKIASMACKAAVKGNHSMNVSEAERLIDELLQLKNPYHCPHGRPTIISMSQSEIERKFKRIV